MPKKKDWIIIITILAVAVAIWGVFHLIENNKKGYGKNNYILVTAGEQEYNPIHMDTDKDFTIEQKNGEINVLHITKTSVVMKHSNCENQDCIMQGEITLDNYKDRVLGNLIVCLPNHILVEMVSQEDVGASK